MLATIDLPNSSLVSKTHPLTDEVGQEVNGYFLAHWPFPSEKAKLKFFAAGFPRVTCLYFPLALNDRIHFACRLLTILFLVDDLLEHMSLKDGADYNDNLIRIMRREQAPDRSVPAEYLMHDIWESMRAHDYEMAEGIVEPVVVFMRAQTDASRLKPMGMDAYFRYREKDVGKALLEALMRFSMALRLPPTELDAAAPITMICARHLSVINDIWSYEKELKASETLHEEGGALCTSVAVLAEATNLSIVSTKRVLYIMCREWERQFVQERDAILAQNNTPSMRAYLLGLEYQMSGNELWSRTTARYRS